MGNLSALAHTHMQRHTTLPRSLLHSKWANFSADLGFGSFFEGADTDQDVHGLSLTSA